MVLMTPEDIERRFHVPTVSDWHEHGWWYIAAVTREHCADMTELEIRQIASFTAYTALQYSYVSSRTQDRVALNVAVVDDRPTHVIILSGRVTVVFGKRDGVWGFRRSTWETGPWPWAYGEKEPRYTSLVQLLDEKIVRYHPGWGAWKAAHPDVFPPEAA